MMMLTVTNELAVPSTVQVEATTACRHHHHEGVSKLLSLIQLQPPPLQYVSPRA